MTAWLIKQRCEVDSQLGNCIITEHLGFILYSHDHIPATSAKCMKSKYQYCGIMNIALKLIISNEILLSQSQ